MMASSTQFELLQPALSLAFEPCSPACRASVIIPARNEEAILERTLDALREQRDLNNDALPFTCYEVLLLLNNCTDRSREVAERYQRDYPRFQLHLAVRELDAEVAFVGTARRLLMDAAYRRLRGRHDAAILSTDADTVVAPDWLARNLAALDAGAEVVGGVIHLFPQDLEMLERDYPGVYRAYRADRDFQRLVAKLESLLDPDDADPWPRHLEHFGASLACTPEVYERAGGVPPIRHLEDVAFIDELRKVDARIRHSNDVHIFTSSRFDGRAEIGLSWQLRTWREDADENLPQEVDSVEWLEHRFQMLHELRLAHRESWNAPSSSRAIARKRVWMRRFPEAWHPRLAKALKEHRSTARFLEALDCNSLIEHRFASLDQPRREHIDRTLLKLEDAIARHALPPSRVNDASVDPSTKLLSAVQTVG